MSHDPAELLQRLIRFDTTNPPGNEAACIAWIREVCEGAGLETRILAKDPARPNLIARVPGRGEAPPLLLQGHVDVVTTAGQEWTRDPFGGELVDGEIWGRGALDMKGGVAMMLGATLALAESGQAPPGDVLLCALSDEEALGTYGAAFLVDEHADVLDGVKHAIGEFGGARTEFAGIPSYPIQVAEKTVCWTRVTIRGPGGHGSLPMRGGAMARLGRLLAKLDERRLPVHITQVPETMIGALAGVLPEHGDELKQALLDPERTDVTLDALGEQGELLDAMLHNTVNATIVRGGDKVNVIPSEIVLELDGRLLPGQTPDDLFRELRECSGDDELESRGRVRPGAGRRRPLAAAAALGSARARGPRHDRGPDAAAGGHRRAPVRPDRNPELRLPADAAARGRHLHEADPRRRRACAGRRGPLGRRPDRRGARALQGIGFRSMQIDGSGALVAGGASGLGEATSRALHAAGARVVIADLNEDKGRALADELGEGATFMRADVTEPDTVQAAVDAVERSTGCGSPSAAPASAGPSAPRTSAARTSSSRSRP